MASEIVRARVAFGWVTGDDDAETKYVSPRSNPIDLAHLVLRAVIAPEGIQLGAITVETSHDDFGTVTVPLALNDGDDSATLMRVDGDWPLFSTTFHVEHPRDEPFELFLIAQNR